MNFYNGDFCWLCSTPSSYCNCEFSDSAWSRSTSQESFCTFDGRKYFDADEPASDTIDGSYFLADHFESTDFGVDGMMQCLERGSQQPCAASTPKNNGYAEIWESPGAMPPPESSSPVGLDADSSPFPTDPVLPLSVSRREDRRSVDRHLFCYARDNERSHVKALFNDRADSNAPISPTTMTMSPLPHPPTLKFLARPVPSAQTNMDASLHVQGHPTETFEGTSSMLALSSQASFFQRPRGHNRRRTVPDAALHDICAVNTRITIEQDEIDRVSAPRSLMPASRKKALFSGPTILDLAISTELEPHGDENVWPCDIATTTRSETSRDEGVPSKMPYRRVSLISVSRPAQAAMNNRLKRRRSSVDSPPEAKKVKLERTLSHVSCTSNASVQSKYQATEAASLRRARSLMSDASSCFEESTNSFFYPSPRPCVDKDCAPTVPSTPIANSADYARSRANPLARTLAVYRRRSLDIPVIPPVPIIAPPPHVTPTVVRCAEDQAIDRLEALFLRERLERKRDGLNVHDEKRKERLKSIQKSDDDVSFPRRDSASTSGSSDVYSEWEEESTRSAIESQDRLVLAPSVKLLPEEYRLANLEAWSNAFGIANNFRKEITGWILRKLPKKPAKPTQADTRPRGTDLWEQLTQSHQTRFHAAQFFHRYFLRREKVMYWREACKYDHFQRKFTGSHDHSDYERCIWDLAVACMALAVKLHRDCLKPLSPVYADEFLEMAPHSIIHETLELAQRDILYTFEFQLGSCTPQDVMDELWNALPTLRRETVPVGWAVVQSVTWEMLFKSLLEPDMLQYPVTLLTAAALVEGLTSALESQYKKDDEANLCKCRELAETPVSVCVLDDAEEMAQQIRHTEATKLLSRDVIPDIRDVLHLSKIELDQCQVWLNHVCQD
ncbi:hypothetical protein OG21DRAFT_1501533 [Imleria badia]|nr:hypothetical protein OG21DRAFT_1501533 [Imleria badia]